MQGAHPHQGLVIERVWDLSDNFPKGGRCMALDQVILTRVMVIYHKKCFKSLDFSFWSVAMLAQSRYWLKLFSLSVGMWVQSRYWLKPCFFCR